jgi:hypothetical protein
MLRVDMVKMKLVLDKIERKDMWLGGSWYSHVGWFGVGWRRAPTPSGVDKGLSEPCRGGYGTERL